MEHSIEMNNKIFNALCELGDSETKFFHYTTMSGITGIFKNYIEQINKNDKSKKEKVSECNLRASNVRFLNDSMEYKEGVFTLKEASSSIVDSEFDENIYNISFCKDGNLLSQWDRYGKNSGIAIEFDFSQNIKLGFVRHKKRGEEEKNAICRWNYRPISVEYKNQLDLLKRIKDTINSKIVGKDTNEIVSAVFVPFCKNIGFEQEEESRIILYAPPIENFIYNLQYIVDEKSGTVKPCLDVLFNVEKGSSIIKSLTVGPGKNQNLIFNSLIHIFDRENYRFYDEDTIAAWDPRKNHNGEYFFGDENGQAIPQALFDEILVDDLTNINKIIADYQKRKNCEQIIKTLMRTVSAVEKEQFQIVLNRVKKHSTKYFIIHRCQNGILIKKSLIPYRG